MPRGFLFELVIVLESRAAMMFRVRGVRGAGDARGMVLRSD